MSPSYFTVEDFTHKRHWDLKNLRHELQQRVGILSQARGRLAQLRYGNFPEILNYVLNREGTLAIREKLIRTTPLDLTKYPDILDKAAKVIELAQLVQVLFGNSIFIPQNACILAVIYPLTDTYIDDRSGNLLLKNFLLDYLDKIIQKKPHPINLPGISHRIERLATNFFEGLKNEDDPHLTATLLRVNESQRVSLKQNNNDELPDFAQLFQISIEKGAASFELLGRTLDQNISEKRVRFLNQFGGLFQLVDDIMDIKEDKEEHIMTSALYAAYDDPTLTRFNSNAYADYLGKVMELWDDFFAEHLKPSSDIEYAALTEIRLKVMKGFQELLDHYCPAEKMESEYQHSRGCVVM